MKQHLEPIAIAERLRSLIGTDTEIGFAHKLGLCHDSIVRYLRGQVPDPTSLVRIAEVCDVSSDWLLRGATTDQKTPARDADPDASESVVPPPVNLVLNHPTLADTRGFVSNSILVKIIRDVIHDWPRFSGRDGADVLLQIASTTARRAEMLSLPRRNYVNATGIIIHTGWGNAPFHPKARERLAQGLGASPTGAAEALPRMETCERLLRAVTGAEAATVTTLNAASLSLVAGALAAGRHIVVAARDLVEISEGARVSDILQATGAQLVSVGAVNCVYIADYARAITPTTAMLMRIRASNMATSGYTAHVSGADLAHLAQKHNVVYVDNLGGGSLVELKEQALPECPTLQQGIRDGAHLVLASGDKIIGGPQAGLIVGKKDYVQRLSKHVLARTCRPGKLTLAALEGTLAVYLAGRAWEEIPTLRMLKMPEHELSQRAATIGKAVSAAGLDTEVSPDTTECGGAVLPGVLLPTWTVHIKHSRLKENQLYDVLLARGVIARRAQGKVILDLRSVLPEDDSVLLNAIVDSLEPVALRNSGLH